VISKQVVWQAYQKVKANRGAAGVDVTVHGPRVTSVQIRGKTLYIAILGLTPDV
jgi:hypothetical protein